MPRLIVTFFYSFTALLMFSFMSAPSFALTPEEAKALLSKETAAPVITNTDTQKGSGGFVTMPGMPPASSPDKPVEIIEKTVVKPLGSVPEEPAKTASPQGKSEIEK